MTPSSGKGADMHIAIEALCLGEYNTGIGVCVSNLLAGLRELDTDETFTLYTSDFPGVHELVRPSGARVVTVNGSAGNRLVRAAWRQFLLNRNLKRDGVQVLHGTAYVLPRTVRVPSVVTIHDVIALTHPEFCPTLNAWHLRATLRRTVANADRIIVHSKATADALVSRLAVPAEKISLLRPGIAERFFREVSKQDKKDVALRYRLPEQYVLFAGNLEPKKDLGTLLRAFEGLSSDTYDGKLLLTGPGGWKNRPLVDRMKGLGDRIQWIGHVCPEDMPALYAGADVTVLVSRVEGFGLPVVESMAAGTPVIASDIPGLAEASADAAMKVKPGDPDDLARALKQVLDDARLREALQERGRRHAERFHSAAYAREHLTIYRELE